MSIYRPKSVSEVPTEYLEQWRVMELQNGERHLVGRPQSTCDGRVSSSIVKTEGSNLTTQSGRLYQLTGPSGYNDDAQYVWEIWCRANGVAESAKDVSDEYSGKKR